ncbi:MAG: hypothetical protein AABZ02_09315 [Bacteroidota bacterium]
MKLKQFLSYRSHRIALLLVAVVSLACTQIPLFNYLGFEFSALIAVVASLLAGLLAISMWRRSQGEYNGKIVSFTLQCNIALGLLLALPFVIITANALFVKNCSFLHGMLLFLLIPVPAVLLAFSMALVISVLAEKWRKTWFVLLWLLILLHILYVTFTRPQIFAFNPIVGFFPGFTYDESLEVINRLLIYRAGTLALSLALILLAMMIDRRRNRESGQAAGHQPIKRHLVVMSVLLAAVVGLFLFSDELGLSSSEGSISTALGGRAETDHFLISYPDSALKGRRLSHIIQLHEFTFDRLARTLRVNPRRKIHTFLYTSAEQKGRLIGAAGTNIAKPWLWQLHLNLSDVEASFQHELTHVVAAEFGFPLFRIGVNSGLIEGLATALERTRYGEHLHRLAAMVFAVGLDPDMESLFSLSGFVRAHPDVGYTLAGSFCRYLIDRYGLRRFKLLYRGGDYATLYNKGISTLLHEWRQYVNRYELSDGEIEKAAYLFKRPSIFAKECARVVANANAETRVLLAQKKYEEALESTTRSLSHTMSVEAVLQRTNALVRLKRYREAIEFAGEKLRDSTIRHSLLTLKLVLGDALWAVDSARAARTTYEELLRTHLSLSWDEAATVRQEALSDASLVRDLNPYFTTDLADSAREELLGKLISGGQKNLLPRYLLARELASNERFEEAVREFDGISRMHAAVLEQLRQQRIARAYFALGKYQKAEIHYWQSLNYVTEDVQALQIEEKLKFCEWMENYLKSLD